MAGRGQAYEGLGEPDRALADYAAALRADPDNAPVRFRRGVLYRLAGKPARRWRTSTGRSAASPRTRPRTSTGVPPTSRGDHGRAVAELDEAVGRSPAFAQAYLVRALAHDRMDAFQDAADDCGRALALDPHLAAAFLIRGTVCNHARMFERAVDDLTRAVELDPDLTVAYLERGRALTRRGALNEALADYTRVLGREPRNALAYANRAIVHRLKGDLPAAVEDAAAALRLDPKTILKGWDEGLADVARRRHTRGLADYAEGRRPAPPEAAAVPTASAEHFEAPTDAAADPVRAETPRPAPAVEPEPVIDLADATAERILLAEAETAEAEAEAAAPAAVEEPAAPAFVRCPMCQSVGPPAEALSGGRVKCGRCQAAFLPAPAAPAAKPPLPASKPTPAKAAKRRHGRPPRAQLGQARRPGRERPRACRRDRRGRVVRRRPAPRWSPSKGEARFQGRAMPGALVTLHPFGEGSKKSEVPHPRGVVKDDGSFVLGTYGEADGAPPGEYEVTVHWFVKGKGDEEGPGRAALPAKYGSTKTSGLKVHVQPGRDALEPINLGKPGEPPPAALAGRI